MARTSTKKAAAKGKAKTKAKAKTRKPRPRRPKNRVWTSDDILTEWRKALQRGLGRKKLSRDIDDAVAGPLGKHVAGLLAAGQDFNLARDATLEVAEYIGEICRLSTHGNEVSLAVFELAFELGKLHHRCPGGGGSGQWCSV
jgi:hypothetical protein